MNKVEAKKRVCLFAAKRLREEARWLRRHEGAYNRDYALDIGSGSSRRKDDAERILTASDELARELERRGNKAGTERGQREILL